MKRSEMKDRINFEIPEGTVLKPVKEDQSNVTYVGCCIRGRKTGQSEELHVYWVDPMTGSDNRHYERRLRVVDRHSLMGGYQIEQYIKKVEPKEEAEKLRKENTQLRCDLSAIEARLARLESKGVTLVKGDPLR